MSDYESQTVAELQDLAAEREIEGRSGLNKSELIKALESTDPLPPTDEPVGDPEIPIAAQITVRVENIEARVAAIEARLQALDDRTRASTQILGQ